MEARGTNGGMSEQDVKMKPGMRRERETCEKAWHREEDEGNEGKADAVKEL